MSVPRTNIAFILRLMQISRHGAMMQLWLIECIRRYGEMCKKTPLEEVEKQFGENSFISAKGWKGTGEEALERLDEYFDKVGEAWKNQPTRISIDEQIDKETFRGLITPDNKVIYHITDVGLMHFVNHSENDVKRWATQCIEEGRHIHLSQVEVRPFSVEENGLVIEVEVDTTRWDRKVNA